MPDIKKYIKTPEGQPDLVEMKAKVKSGPLKGKRVAVLLDADDVVRDQVKEQAAGFVNFLREHAVVGVAIGFVVGSQAQQLVKGLTDGFFAPTLQLLLGGARLQDQKFYVRLWGNGVDYMWGNFVYFLIYLIFSLAIIYALIKILNLDKLEKPKNTVEPASKTKKK